MTPYLPLDGRGWRLHMGLRPLEVADWLEFDDQSDELIELKGRLIDTARSRVVAADPAGDEPSAELLELVRSHLGSFHLDRPAVAGADHPVVEAARLVGEDLCVMVREDQWRLRAACVCFPSRWDLSSKLGATLREIHEPVPGYDEALGRPVDAFFDRLDEHRSFWRLNWTLLDSPELYLPEGSRRSPSGHLGDWFFRVERQTFRVLPHTRAVVFTIRTYVTPAEELARHDETFRTSLTTAMASAPAAVQAYKGWLGVAERLADG